MRGGDTAGFPDFGNGITSPPGGLSSARAVDLSSGNPECVQRRVDRAGAVPVLRLDRDLDLHVEQISCP